MQRGKIDIQISQQANQTSPQTSPSTHFPYPEIDQRDLPQRSMATPLTLKPSSPSITSHHFAEPAHNGPILLSRPRPKLSLNTTSCTPRILGRGNTGLRLDVLSADSPTSRNTYKNTFEESGATTTMTPQPAPLTSSPQPLAIPSMSADSTQHPLRIETKSCRRSSSTSTSTVSTTDSSPPHSPKIPYTLSSHIRPILTNSRLPKRARIAVNSATTPKVLFPPVKRVCWSQPLSEEVKNERFKWRHFDLLEVELVNQDDEKDAGPDNVEPTQAVEELNHEPTLALTTLPDNTTTGKKVYDDDESDDSDDAAYPKTPIAGRRKKIREWAWTLGPLPSSSTTEDDKIDTSHADLRLDER